MSHNQQLPTSSRVIILLLMATVLPSVALLIFSEQIAQYPMLALGLGILYEVSLLVVGFRFRSAFERASDNYYREAKHGLELEPQLARPVAEEAAYRARYLRAVVICHRQLDVTGVATALQVEQLFVELLLAPLPQHKTLDDPIRMLPAELSAGQHAIWAYLELQHNFLLIGSPGSGKSTLLKHIALVLAGDVKRRQQLALPNTLPILISLRHHIAQIQSEPDFALTDAVVASFSHMSDDGLPITSEAWLEAQLERGDCLVLLDGLDEVMYAYERVHEWVVRQVERWSNNRFVVTSRLTSRLTSRSNDYWMLPGFTVLKIQPLSSEQVTDFVHHWYEVHYSLPAFSGPKALTIDNVAPHELDLLMKIEQKANDLLQHIHSTHGLSELAVNPLFLTMMAIIHCYRGRVALPKNFDWVGPPPRVDLYDEICQLLFENSPEAPKSRRNWQKKPPQITPKQKKRALQPLAFHMMCHLQREISNEDALPVIAQPLAQAGGLTELREDPNPQKEWLQLLVKNSGLLREGKNESFAFTHYTFQEYMTAIYLLEQRLGEGLRSRVNDEWWHESIRLYSAKTDATLIIQACLDFNSLPALVLAAACLEETHNVQPTVRAEVIVRLQQAVEHVDPQWRRQCAQALLSLRLRTMKRVTDRKYVDDTLITHAEYQLFLDDQRAYGRYYQPDHWIDDHFAEGMGNASVVGVSPQAALSFCQWLTKQRPTTKWAYRLPQPKELDPESVETPWRKQISLGYWVSSANDIEYVEIDPLVPIMTSEHLWELVHNDRARAFDQSLDFDRALARSLGLDLSGTLERYSYRALDRYHAMDSYLNHALMLVRNRPCDFDRYRARDLTGYRDLDPYRARKLARYRHLDVDLYLYDDLYRALYLVLNLERDLYLDPTIAPSYNRYEISRFLRWYVRYCVLILGTTVAQIMVEQAASSVAPVRMGHTGPDVELESLISTYTELYVTFAILEERTRGNQPAFEGIRIVMEREKE